MLYRFLVVLKPALLTGLYLSKSCPIGNNTQYGEGSKRIGIRGDVM